MSPMAAYNSTNRAPKVLVVDDEDNISFLVTAALRLDGFDTATAANGGPILDSSGSSTRMDHRAYPRRAPA